MKYIQEFKEKKLLLFMYVYTIRCLMFHSCRVGTRIEFARSHFHRKIQGAQAPQTSR